MGGAATTRAAAPLTDERMPPPTATRTSTLPVAPLSDERMPRGATRVVVAVLALLAAPALASDRYDHRGALGLTVAAGGEIVAAAGNQVFGDNGVRVPLELGGTASITDHTELRAAGRVSLLGLRVGSSAYLGLRNTYGWEKLKTFFDLDFAAHFTPIWTLGARVGLGVQYDFLPVMGAYAQLGGQLGGGGGLRLSFELLVGVQLRTYLLE